MDSRSDREEIAVIEKKVLIITYYWPPSGGSGVQRWLKFVKYLPEHGYTPYVFTPENPSFDLKDESLLQDVPAEAEVIHFPIWEPYKAFNSVVSLVSKTGDTPSPVVSSSHQSLFKRVSTWIRGNLIIPDPRVFWVKSSANFLHDFIKDNKIKSIITTGPPHSVHLIGLRLKRKNPSLKWMADFRDPWSEWGLLDTLNVGSVARSLHRRLEKKVLQTADKIVTITPYYVRRFSALSGRKTELLTNGFDEDDFRDIKYTTTGKFIIRHVGIVNEKCDPRPFMNAMKQLLLENEEFAQKAVLEFVGKVDSNFVGFVKSDEILKQITSFMPSVDHKTLIQMYGSSSLLLLILEGYKGAEGYMPGKLFEYFATGLPILGVGPSNGDAASLMEQIGAGQMINSGQDYQIKQYVLKHFQDWKKENRAAVRRVGINMISRRAITAQLVELLDD